MVKKKDPFLGRALIKAKSRANKNRKTVDNNSMLHTTELNDGQDWGRLNLQSVTEESSFQEFISTAELAGTEFRAEKLNFKIINPNSIVGLLTDEEAKKASRAHDKFKECLKIPRRPPWKQDMSPSELDRNEKEEFLNWRRSLATLQDEEDLLLTPYEKNLEFWRQLWRVIERSDVLVQIVDARNPLLFRCEDLERYVKEVSEHKINLLLINKADLLTDRQRKSWAEYFRARHVRVAFFSALEPKKASEENDIKERVAQLGQRVEQIAENLENILSQVETLMEKTNIVPADGDISNCPYTLSKEDLIELFRTIHRGPKVTSEVTTIGLVGYPNVGKSSTINSLLSSKKVSVSATPGKTKHFQTHYLDKDILLCDCPGLVMPSFVHTKAEMILNGILPIDHMRDHVAPTTLVTKLIPSHIFEDTYNILLPEKSISAEELLNSYAYNRGFMTANGQPDNPRAARYILKDFVNGKLLYCHAPPGENQDTYLVWPEKKTGSEKRTMTPREARAIRSFEVTSEDVDREFFAEKGHRAHSKGIPKKVEGISQPDGAQSNDAKPWKALNKHRNKKKKEKLRRVYAHLDQH